MRTTRRLPCKLTTAEWSERAGRHAKLQVERDDKMEAFKEVASAHRAEIKELDQEMLALAEQVNSKTELRDVPCEERHDRTAHVIEVWRLDTDELVETIRNQQMPLPLAPAAEKPTPAKAIPILMVDAVDIDGVVVRITAEQADQVMRYLEQGGEACVVEVDGRRHKIAALREHGTSAYVAVTVNGHRRICKRDEAMTVADAMVAEYGMGVPEIVAVSDAEAQAAREEPKKSRKKRAKSEDMGAWPEDA